MTMGSIYEELLSAARDWTNEVQPIDRAIQSIWIHEYAARLTSQSSVLHLRYLSIVTARGEGCCYFDGPLEIAPNLLGSDALVATGNRIFDLASLDSLLIGASKTPSESFLLDGPPGFKAEKRARIVADLVGRIALRGTAASPRIVMVGVVGDILAMLSPVHEVVATDFSQHVVGTTVHGVPVYSGARTLDLVRSADIALVTGMTIANGTFDEIAYEAAEHNTALIMYCETGASFSRVLLDNGACAVVSERSPFYLSPDGPSPIAIYER